MRALITLFAMTLLLLAPRIATAQGTAYVTFCVNVAVDYSEDNDVGDYWTDADVGGEKPARGFQATLDQVLVFDAPVSGVVQAELAPARYFGDPYDRAEFAEDRSDLDGDGVNDLLVGAYNRDYGTGRVAVLTAKPEGTHRIWDLAAATLTGTVASAEFGLSLAAGDLDGDGYEDALVGGPLTADDGAYVFRGPFAGDRTAAEADWRIVGDPTAFTWLGYASAIRDLEGDGAADLAVGAPRSVYSGDSPGEVHLFFAPPPGEHLDSTADRTLVSGVSEPDAFGIAIDVGDLDGDGLGDLVIGAPRDPTIGGFGLRDPRPRRGALTGLVLRRGGSESLVAHLRPARRVP